MNLLDGLTPAAVLTLVLLSAGLASALTAAGFLLWPKRTSAPTDTKPEGPDFDQIRAFLEPLPEKFKVCRALAVQKGSKEYIWRVDFIGLVADQIKGARTSDFLFLCRELLRHLEDWPLEALRRMPDARK
jgi:hypothetical protein